MENTQATSATAPATGSSDLKEAPPLPSFDSLPLSQDLRQTLADMGYEVPTPVQLAVWEPATRGRDAIVQARTGTGKTASFGLPIVDYIVRRSLAEVQVLVLCPTRELALQGTAELERLGQRKGVRVVPVYGGAPMPRQIEAIAGGAQVIVGTPGRVLDHLRRGTLSTKSIKLLVLDECDEMLSMGFERELNAILDFLPKERQTLLFSATLPPDIDRIARSKLKTPEVITLSGDHIGALSIDHFVYMVASDKIGVLTRMIEVENPESAIVFCNTRDETERVAQALMRQGFDADWLNGDMAQNEREEVMARTREGRLRFLVATDVAARGIDVSHLTHVINHDFPQDAESYVHRTGRTGRAGRTGTAISLITPQDIGGLYLLRLTYKIRPLERQVPSEGDLKTRAEADLVTMMVDAFLPKGVHPEDLALARRLLSHDESERIVAGLLREHLGARPTAQDEASAARRANRPALPPTGRRVSSREGRHASGRPPAMAAPVAAPTPAAVVAPAPMVMAAPATPSPTTPTAAAAPVVAGTAPAPDAAPVPRFDDRGPRPRRDGGEPRRRDDRRPDDRRPERRERRDFGAPVDGPRDVAPPVVREGVEKAPVSQGATLVPDGREGEPRRNRRPRHADFATWQPPEEEGDDQPIFGANGGPAPMPFAPSAATPSPSPVVDAAPPAAPLPAFDPADYVDLFVNVGRRDAVKAADLQRVLEERGGFVRDDVRRIRVRDRNTFVSIKKEHAERAIAALNGAMFGTRMCAAEIARERPTDDGGAPPAAT